jgi:hypothetical protein
LAHHTATAQHVAQKLARHFVADEPPPPLVTKLARAFMDSDGNLKAVAKALVTADEAWTPARTKLKRPSEWLVSMLRLTSASLNAGAPWNIGRVLAVQATLGESLWRPPAPNGWPDTEAAWIDGVPHRLDIANEFAGHLPSSDPAALLESGLGPIASHNTRDTIARGEPHPGSCASCHGAGISAEITMRFVHAPTRREMLLASGTLFAWAHLPRLAYAEGRDPRFLTIILRGALDGLATVAPVGDPDWAALRGDNALTLEGKTPALKLNDFFALNPAMPNLHRLFKANQAIVVHACATPYRERSHFDGQDLLESGLAKPAPSDSGWLNRALASLASAGRVDPHGSVTANVKGGKAFAVGPVTPLVVRGPAPVLSWSPQRIQPASADTVQRLLDVYRHTDVKLAGAIDESIKLAAIEHSGDKAQKPGGPRPAQVRGYFAEAAGTAAKFLAQPDGPRVGRARARRLGYAQQ